MVVETGHCPQILLDFSVAESKLVECHCHRGLSRFRVRATWAGSEYDPHLLALPGRWQMAWMRLRVFPIRVHADGWTESARVNHEWLSVLLCSVFGRDWVLSTDIRWSCRWPGCRDLVELQASIGMTDGLGFQSCGDRAVAHPCCSSSRDWACSQIFCRTPRRRVVDHQRLLTFVGPWMATVTSRVGSCGGAVLHVMYPGGAGVLSSGCQERLVFVGRRTMDGHRHQSQPAATVRCYISCVPSSWRP